MFWLIPFLTKLYLCKITQVPTLLPSIETDFFQLFSCNIYHISFSKIKNILKFNQSNYSGNEHRKFSEDQVKNEVFHDSSMVAILDMQFANFLKLSTVG